MAPQSYKIEISQYNILSAQAEIRRKLVFILAASIFGTMLVKWLTGTKMNIGEDFWIILISILSIGYFLIYVVSRYFAAKPRFKAIEFSDAGLHFPPFTGAPVPWSQIDEIEFANEAQYGTGEYVSVSINREYYRQMKSATFDFVADERKRFSKCSIKFHMSVLPPSEFSFEQLVDQFAPQLKKMIGYK